MGGPVRPWIILALLALFTVTAVTDARSGEQTPSRFRVGDPEWSTGNTLLLSLQIAKAKKNGKRIARYKSLARQRKLNVRRPFGGTTGPPPTGTIVTGRHPPWGR